MSDAVIIDVIRTPMGKGKPGGALSNIHPVELLSQTLSNLIQPTQLDPALVDDLIVGCVGQVLEQSSTPGRTAWLAAGFPEEVPSVTVERRCGSGQQALDFAVQGVQSGAYDVVIAAGLESMSRVPMGSNRKGADQMTGRMRSRYPGLVNQGVAAELVADRFDISRDDLDRLSAQSHARAHRADIDGLFAPRIGPVTGADGDTVERDESIRPTTTVEKLSGLNTAFDSDEMRRQFPDLEWKVTAGNSSQVTDGAGAILVMSEKKAAELHLDPLAKVLASAVVGDDPIHMLTGVIPATEKVLARAEMDLNDIDHVEVNEAFASVPLAWMRQFDVDDAKVNPLGGAIALGHPLGASGIRLLSSMIAGLEHTGGRYGLQTMCEAGGMANALILERL